EPEVLDGQAGDDGPEGHGPAQPARARTAVGIKVAHDAAGKTVAGTGRIDYVGCRKSRHHEGAVVAEEHGAVLALLDDDELWPQPAHGPACTYEVVLPCQQPSLAVVEQQAVQPGQQGGQLVPLGLDP